MHIKNLQKAGELLEQLLAIDAEIIQLEKLAEICADGDVIVKMSLNIRSTKAATDVNRNIFDEHGFLKPEYNNGPKPDLPLVGYLVGPIDSVLDQIRQAKENFCDPRHFPRSAGFANGAIDPSKKTGTGRDIDREISDVNTLQILGWILYEKNQNRQMILDQLQACGIVI